MALSAGSSFWYFQLKSPPIWAKRCGFASAAAAGGLSLAKAMPVSKELPENYVSPIAVCGLDPEDELNYMDSGLPILNITVVDSVEDIFTELENCECGLSAGIFSKDSKLIDRFKNEVDVPQMFINESSRSLRPAFGAVLEKFVK